MFVIAIDIYFRMRTRGSLWLEGRYVFFLSEKKVVIDTSFGDKSVIYSTAILDSRLLEEP